MTVNSIKQYGIWSWGHVIYDYRGFLDNMKRLGMNSVIIWNDIVPLNSEDVLDYAHSLGIKVIWGFAWGWVDKCGENVKSIDAEVLQKLSDDIADTFAGDYQRISPDGIYFQSFTELGSDSINGVSVAEAVTELVNKTAARIFEKSPSTEILFGLHTTSVKDHLDTIAKVDPRIRIIWEDCGAFPFAYDPLCTDGFDETKSFADKCLHLRGEDEKSGFIIKGMTTLDWSCFEYHTEPYTIGEASRELIEAKKAEVAPKWEKLTEGWKKNYGLCRDIIRQIADSGSDVYLYGLVEDGLFETEIPKPAALLSAIIRDPNLTDSEAAEIIMK